MFKRFKKHAKLSHYIINHKTYLLKNVTVNKTKKAIAFSNKKLNDLNLFKTYLRDKQQIFTRYKKIFTEKIKKYHKLNILNLFTKLKHKKLKTIIIMKNLKDKFYLFKTELKKKIYFSLSKLIASLWLIYKSQNVNFLPSLKSSINFDYNLHKLFKNKQEIFNHNLKKMNTSWFNLKNNLFPSISKLLEETSIMKDQSKRNNLLTLVILNFLINNNDDLSLFNSKLHSALTQLSDRFDLFKEKLLNLKYDINVNNYLLKIKQIQEFVKNNKHKYKKLDLLFYKFGLYLKNIIKLEPKADKLYKNRNKFKESFLNQKYSFKEKLKKRTFRKNLKYKKRNLKKKELKFNKKKKIFFNNKLNLITQLFKCPKYLQINFKSKSAILLFYPTISQLPLPFSIKNKLNFI